MKKVSSIIFSLFLPIIVLAWAGPQGIPPTANTPPPLNVSTQGQTKLGPLVVNPVSNADGTWPQNGIFSQNTIRSGNEIHAPLVYGDRMLCIRNDCRDAWPAGGGGGGGNGVSSIRAGNSNILVNSTGTNGTGDVTISGTGGGSGGSNYWSLLNNNNIGNINAGGIDVTGKVSSLGPNRGFCIGTICIKDWPDLRPIIGGITSLTAGTGITLSPNPIVTTGTISANTSQIISATGDCGPNKVLQGIENGTNGTTLGRPICVEKIQCTGSSCPTPTGPTGSGTTNFLTKWIGGTSLGNTQIYEGRYTGTDGIQANSLSIGGASDPGYGKVMIATEELMLLSGDPGPNKILTSLNSVGKVAWKSISELGLNGLWGKIPGTEDIKNQNTGNVGIGDTPNSLAKLSVIPSSEGSGNRTYAIYATNNGGTYGVYGRGIGAGIIGRSVRYGVVGVSEGSNGVGGQFINADGLAIESIGKVKISDGTQGAGRILASDDIGQASWKTKEELGLGGGGSCTNPTTTTVDQFVWTSPVQRGRIVSSATKTFGPFRANIKNNDNASNVVLYSNIGIAGTGGAYTQISVYAGPTTDIADQVLIGGFEGPDVGGGNAGGASTQSVAPVAVDGTYYVRVTMNGAMDGGATVNEIGYIKKQTISSCGTAGGGAPPPSSAQSCTISGQTITCGGQSLTVNQNNTPVAGGVPVGTHCGSYQLINQYVTLRQSCGNFTTARRAVTSLSELCPSGYKAVYQFLFDDAMTQQGDWGIDRIKIGKEVDNLDAGSIFNCYKQ